MKGEETDVEEEFYKLILDGQILEGRDPDTVKADLGRLFGLDGEGVERLLTNAPVEVKRNIPKSSAAQFKAGITSLGAACHLERMSTAELVKCPACGYQSTGEDDALIKGAGGLGECPNCNAIQSELKKPPAPEAPKKAPAAAPKPAAVKPVAAAGPPAAKEAPAEAPAAEKAKARKPESKLPPLAVASRGRRALAALHSLFSSLCVIILFMVPALFIKHYYAMLVPASAGAAADSAEAVRAAIFFLGGAAILVYITMAWIVPAKNGRSFGQKAMGIEIRTRKGGTPNGAAFFLRFIGNTLVMASCGILMILTLAARDRASLADLLSGTRQHESAEPPGKHVQKALTPILVAFFLAAAIVLLLSPLVMKTR